MTTKTINTNLSPLQSRILESMNNIGQPVDIQMLRERGNIPKADFVLDPCLHDLKHLGYVNLIGIN